MKLAIMQPYLFPYIGYFHLLQAVDVFVILDDVNYIKGGFINRNYILSNGKANLFTFPVKNSSPNKLIKDIFLDKMPKFFKTIKCEYNKAPYKKDIVPLLQDILEDHKDGTLLAEFITKSLMKICKFFDIKCEFILSSKINKDNSLKGQNRVKTICKCLKATTYINSPGGVDLYNKESFADNDIKLMFLKHNKITYKQFNNPFVPNLSIIDVMMFNSKNQLKQLLQTFECFCPTA